MMIDVDINKVVEKVVMQAKETQEEFIFETIHPWCENVLQIKISKEELKQILLNGIQKQQPEDTGEISDGYHTFNQLYHQRAILFATIVNQNKDKAWKSYKHEDGKYCFDKDGEWFIVGIDTPQGSYTYHYSKEYWDYFDCEELECGKHWDGHTEEDVIRLLSLPSVQPQPKRGKWIPTNDYVTTAYGSLDYYRCLCCGEDSLEEGDYCPNCGARMAESEVNKDGNNTK